MAVVIGDRDASIESNLSSKEARRWSDAWVTELNLLATVFSLVDSSVTDSRRWSTSACWAGGLDTDDGMRESPTVVVGTVGAEFGRFGSEVWGIGTVVNRDEVSDDVVEESA